MRLSLLCVLQRVLFHPFPSCMYATFPISSWTYATSSPLSLMDSLSGTISWRQMACWTIDRLNRLMAEDTRPVRSSAYHPVSPPCSAKLSTYLLVQPWIWWQIESHRRNNWRFLRSKKGIERTVPFIADRFVIWFIKSFKRCHHEKLWLAFQVFLITFDDFFP